MQPQALPAKRPLMWHLLEKAQVAAAGVLVGARPAVGCALAPATGAAEARGATAAMLCLLREIDIQRWTPSEQQHLLTAV
jgi:hypothetical protein